MHRFQYRFSIRTMLILVTLLAVTIAVLVRPSVITAIAYFNIALVLIGIAIVSSFLAHGEQQAVSIAFSVFAGGHLLLALSPPFDRTASNGLISTHLVKFINPDMYPTQRSIDWYKLVEPAPTPVGSGPETAYILTAHSALSLFCGALAAGIVRAILLGKQQTSPPAANSARSGAGTTPQVVS